MSERIPVRIAADLWEEDSPAVISSWYYDVDDEVEEGAVIADLMVEKVTFAIVAPASGRLVSMKELESSVAKGDSIAEIEA